MDTRKYVDQGGTKLTMHVTQKWWNIDIVQTLPMGTKGKGRKRKSRERVGPIRL